jgi:flagellar hook-basal body complex protein FliE
MRILADAKVNPIASPEALLKWFAEGKQGESSQKLYLSAIKNAHPDTFPAVLQGKIDELYKKQNEKAKEQKLSTKQEAKFVAYDTLVATQKALHGVKGQERNYLIASLYILQMPVRADYGDMRVFKAYSKTRKGNEFIFKKTPEFVFREYKTAKTYGEVRIPVSPAMAKVIHEYFEYLGHTPAYLIGDESITPSGFAGLVERVFGVGVSLIRHAFITHIYPTLKTIAQKELVATRMLHSTKLQEEYNLPSKVAEA